MAQYDVTTSGAAFNYNTEASNSKSCFIVDATHFILFSQGSNKGQAYIFAVNTSTWAVTTASTPLDFVSGSRSEEHSCWVIDTNHFIDFWHKQGGAAVEAFTVNTTTWAVTTAGSALGFDTTYGIGHSCQKIDANHFINFWQGSPSYGAGLAQIFTVNTTTWAVTTANASLNFDAAHSGQNKSFMVDTNHVINFWWGNAGDGFVQVFTVNTSTWAVTTANSALEFDTQTADKNACYKIDTNHFINFWVGGAPTEDGTAQVFAVNTSTWAVTTAGARFVFSTDVDKFNDCYVVDSNHFILFWAGTSYGFVETFAVNTSTWEITTSCVALQYTTQGGLFPSCFRIDTNHYINFWSASGQFGYAEVFTVEGQALGPANLKSYNTNLKANIKSINTNLIANVKSLDTNV
jgi:hypothetical protein